jgi:glycosyltransferase involved in cell wall biosynthesis
MKILYVVQRYGEQIVGGSEAACRLFSEELVRRGHKVEVLTSCAHSYIDWADEYEPGSEEINGVMVHRLPVVERRTDEIFGRFHPYVISHPGSLPLFEQQRWARVMGPQLHDQRRWLLENYPRFDVSVFMTYLYSTTTSGLPTLANLLPTVLQPTAHDEPPVYVSLFRSLFRQADAFMYFTPEERLIVERIFELKTQGSTIGIGIDRSAEPGDTGRFRAQFGLSDDPYLLYVGRLDPSKGVGELIRFFLELKRRTQNNLKLVLAGDKQIEIPDHPDIFLTGFLDEQQKRDALAGSLALVQSSYFESFSIVLCESWIQKRPALVQGRCEVLRGQAMRSGGAIPYEGFAEFEASVLCLLDNPELADQMGIAGDVDVKENYEWDVVVQGFENTLALATEQFNKRRLRTRPWQ